MQISKHRKTIETWFQRVWAEEDESAIYEMFVPKGKAGGLGQPTVGPDDFVQFHRALLALISDVRIVIDEWFEDGDNIAVRCTMTGKKRNDPKTSIEMKGACFTTMGKGVLVDAENYFEFMGLFEQLGQLPANCFLKALSGQKFG